jgi:hypothetical protein
MLGSAITARTIGNERAAHFTPARVSAATQVLIARKGLVLLMCGAAPWALIVWLAHLI